MSKLTPPDEGKCQVYSYNPWVMGGECESMCEKTPKWIIHEIKSTRDDGLLGSQSVCVDCRERWEKSTGVVGIDTNYRWEEISDE